jgi:flagellar operon protein
LSLTGIRNALYTDTAKDNKGNKIRSDDAFDKVLQKQIARDSLQNTKKYDSSLGKSEVIISKHAQRRMEYRNINLNQRDINALGDAMNKAESKGARESLLVYKDLVFVSNIQSRTIITTMALNEEQDNIFTNIDSAVFIK